MQVVLVGCGRMGGALLRGWTARDVGPVHVLDPAVEDTLGARRLEAVDDLAALQGPLAVVVAVKPAAVAAVLDSLRPHLGADALVISIAAGVTLLAMRVRLGDGPALVRAMPNTPAAIGKGAVAAVPDAALDAPRRAVADRLLKAAGELLWLEEEALIDAVTAISGSGPAYFYRFTEHLAEAGRALGLDPATADRLATLTFTGAAAWLEASGQSAAQLRAEVTSPGGTTAAAIAAFDENDGLARLVGAATQAAAARSKAMGEGS